MKIINKVKSTIRDHNLISTKDKILIGVSGGPDSVALLHILHQIRCELGIKLYVAHINHNLRKGAGADQHFVEKVSQQLNLKCFSVKIPKITKRGSLEELAREKRFEALFKIAVEKKITKIALAHNQDDIAETVLMRITRGTGLLGLTGIHPKRKINNFTIIRPLVDIPRAKIEDFLTKNNISSRCDPTNKQTKFYRNKIRLKLIPLLEREYNTNIRTVLAGLANNSSVDYAFLQKQAKKEAGKIVKINKTKNEIKIPLPIFKKKDQAMQRLIIRFAIEDIQGNTRRLCLDHIQEIESLILSRPAGSIVNLPKKIKVTKQKEYITISKCH